MRDRRNFVKGLIPAGMAVAAAASPQERAAPVAGNASPAPPPVMVARHDERVEAMLARQITDTASPNAGGYPDAWEIVSPQSGSGAVAVFSAAYFCPASRYNRSAELRARILLAAGFLKRKQLPSGNIDLLTTNFNSPPDTGFVVHNVAPAAMLAQRAGDSELVSALMPFLRKAGAAMAVGGVHTPNHRWVVCAALALIHHLEPDSRYVRRIDQWLAEGIDIDADGLYTERSPLVYSPVVNRSLLLMAEFLARPQLLEPVRRNLEAALHLMHPNGELETGLSGRQDQNTVGFMGVNWLALQYIGERDRNGVLAALARKAEAQYGDLLLWQLLPVLQTRSAPEAAPPENYRKVFSLAALHRIRRGAFSMSVFTQGSDRLLSLRHADAVVEAVRFASAFFGKGQLVPTSSATQETTIEMTQTLRGPYYQPLENAEKIPADPAVWSRSRLQRSQSEVCELTQRCLVFDRGDRIELELSAEGTPNVPVAIEINLRAGMVVENVRTAPASADSFLTTGQPVTIRGAVGSIRLEAPASSHAYTQLRGALPKLPGPSLYVTGFTPFRERVVLWPEGR
jgi:hypothetical protein